MVRRRLALLALRAWWSRVWRAATTPPAKPLLPAPPVDPDAMESFERAFDSRVSGCRRDCACGREFYDNYNSGYDWDEGELEALAKNPNATPLGYAVSSIEFEGTSYVFDCDCWRPRARRIIHFLMNHNVEIADFLRNEQKRLAHLAKHFPTVEG